MLTEGCDKEVYLLSFVPDLAGVYVIEIYVNGRLFSDPYKLTAVPVGCANKCFVECEFLVKLYNVYKI